MLARLRCLIRTHHRPVRHLLGGFRCTDCGAVGADLDEMGFPGMGYVSPTRKLFSREREETLPDPAKAWGRLSSARP